MTIKVPSLCLFSLFIAFEACAARDHGSWKQTLHEKAMIFERDTAERHNILGTYPSIVRIDPPTHYVETSLGGRRTFVDTGELPPGWTFDHGTTGPSNIAHSSSWTGCLLTAEAFRVAFLRDSAGADHPDYKVAHARASEIIGGLRILTLVSGVPGYLARGIALGHGISYEERAGVETRDLWKQGVGKYCHLRYRGGPSHHNYDHVFRGLGIYTSLLRTTHRKTRSETSFGICPIGRIWKTTCALCMMTAYAKAPCSLAAGAVWKVLPSRRADRSWPRRD